MELYTAISLNLTFQPHIYTTCLNGTSLKTNSQVDVIQTLIDCSYTIIHVTNMNSFDIYTFKI